MADTELTMQGLAREALGVQDACNLAGVAHSFPRVVSRVRALLEVEGKGWAQADEHPIVRLWVDKITSLAGVQAWAAPWQRACYAEVERLAAGGAVEGAIAAELMSAEVDAEADTQPAAPECGRCKACAQCPEHDAPRSFDDALAGWLALSQERINAEHARAYPDSQQQPRKLSLDAGGVRYVRVVATDGPGRSAFAFVERATGDIFKPDGWKRPATGPRGNIYTDKQGIASVGELYRYR